MSSQVWFITGASRGLGAAIAREALARGHRVAAVGRSLSPMRAALPEALALAADVTDESAIEAAVAETTVHFGRIDVVVNNAGYGLVGAVEEVSDAEARAVFDVNVFGALAVLRATLPVLRSQRFGRVLNMSSVGGFATAGGVGLYGATKFALEAISEALRDEVAHLGIKVSIVEPGGFRTDFLDTSSLRHAGTVIGDYTGSAGMARQSLAARNHEQRGDPAKAAKAIVDLAALDHPPLRLQLGPDALERIEAKLELVAKELNDWRSVALSTDL